jgi:hypothetical protein
VQAGDHDVQRIEWRKCRQGARGGSLLHKGGGR